MCLLDKSHNIDTFLHKNGETSKFVVDILLDRNTFLKNTESVDVFVEQFHNNNDKPMKTSRILRVKPNIFENIRRFFIFLGLSFFTFFFMFLSFFF